MFQKIKCFLGMHDYEWIEQKSFWSWETDVAIRKCKRCGEIGGYRRKWVD